MPGIAVLLIGPRDLSHDFGASDTTAPAFQDALHRILGAAHAASVATTGILAPRRRHAGLRFIGIGSDATLLTLAGKQPSTPSTTRPT